MTLRQVDEAGAVDDPLHEVAEIVGQIDVGQEGRMSDVSTT
jgi:hypothetical protein